MFKWICSPQIFWGVIMESQIGVRMDPQMSQMDTDGESKNGCVALKFIWGVMESQMGKANV